MDDQITDREGGDGLIEVIHFEKREGNTVSYRCVELFSDGSAGVVGDDFVTAFEHAKDSHEQAIRSVERDGFTRIAEEEK